jgi:chemotaxis family two-component system response regulator Rcp1
MIRPIEILLVEDNPGDVRLTREAFRESRILNELNVVGDGAAAIEYLKGNGPHKATSIPDLVLLDLNLPKLSGREVLQRIKAHELWKVIPVVVLSTSESEVDIQGCYSDHANCYITKPLAFDAFLEVVRQIEDFWLTIVRLPRPWIPE